jgi:hypothetical protein
MKSAALQSVANEQVLYLTTIGRALVVCHAIEIWFVVCRRCYLFAETGEGALSCEGEQTMPEPMRESVVCRGLAGGAEAIATWR